MLVSIAHGNFMLSGLNVYNVATLVLNGGVQTPLILSFDVVGKVIMIP